MNLDYTDEQRMLQDTVRRVVEADLGFAATHGKSAAADDIVWQGLVEMGWMGMSVPEALGGFDGGPVETLIIMEELGRGLVGQPFLGSVVMPLNLLLACAPSDERDGLVAAIVEGSERVSAALTDADIAGCQTVAAPGQDDDFVLTGCKVLVLGGSSASVALVRARLPSGQPGLFMVRLDAPGVARRGYTTFDGREACEIVFEAAAARLLQRDAEAAIARGLDASILALCAELVGSMARATEVSADYVHVRQQFKQPLAGFQVVQHRLADMFMLTEASRSMVLAALAEAEAADDSRSAAASACLIEVMENAREVTGLAVHQHGGMGMTMELEVGHHYRRAKVAAALLGDLEYHMDRYISLQGRAG